MHVSLPIGDGTRKLSVRLPSAKRTRFPVSQSQRTSYDHTLRPSIDRTEGRGNSAQFGSFVVINAGDWNAINPDDAMPEREGRRALSVEPAVIPGGSRYT